MTMQTPVRAGNFSDTDVEHDHYLMHVLGRTIQTYGQKHTFKDLMHRGIGRRWHYELGVLFKHTK